MSASSLLTVATVPNSCDQRIGSLTKLLVLKSEQMMANHNNGEGPDMSFDKKQLETMKTDLEYQINCLNSCISALDMDITGCFRQHLWQQALNTRNSKQYMSNPSLITPIITFDSDAKIIFSFILHKDIARALRLNYEIVKLSETICHKIFAISEIQKNKMAQQKKSKATNRPQPHGNIVKLDSIIKQQLIKSNPKMDCKQLEKEVAKWEKKLENNSLAKYL